MTIYANKRQPLRGFYWPSYTKSEVNAWRQEKYQYDRRRDAGQQAIQGGESALYLDNISSFKRRYQAEKDGRKMSLGEVIIIAAPVAAAAIAEVAPVAIVTKLSSEAGLVKIGAQIAARKYGTALVGSTLVNAAQNGGDITKLDLCDIGINTFSPANSVSSVLANSFHNLSC